MSLFTRMLKCFWTTTPSRLLVLCWLTGAICCARPAFSQQSDEHAQDSAATSATREESPTAVISDPESMFPHSRESRFWLAGQANFIFQTHPGFHALYSGPNSLSPRYEKATSRVLTLYTGVQLNDSTEVLVDVEEAGGAALSTGLGLGGNTDLDIVRNPKLSKAPYLARAMVHKVIALSHDKIENERGYLCVLNSLPQRRLEIRFGKFSMPDFFDVNLAGSDTHFQFTNWTIDDLGSWDYAADTRGYTVGLLLDYEDRKWAFRFAEALMPKVANGPDLVWRPWQVHAENWEYELHRGILPRKPGSVHVLAYTNYANMGIYRQAVTQFKEGLASRPDITNHPWHITRKYGFGANLEQDLTLYLKAFARWGWDDGKTESFAYTEVDSNVSGGVVWNGAQWKRKQDRAGLAFVTNGIKKDHQAYLANGGLGFLLGDERLNYGRENILEVFYTAHLWKGIYLAPGAQYIVNPGYNRDRGPVIVPTLRGHVEF
jgi:high affinity Mn2+ porin